MAYRIEIETRARKELLELPKEATHRLASVLDDLERNPALCLNGRYGNEFLVDWIRTEAGLFKNCDAEDCHIR